MKRFVYVLAFCLLSTSAFAQEKPADDQAKTIAALQEQIKTLSVQVSTLAQQLAQPKESTSDSLTKMLLATKANWAEACDAFQGGKGKGALTFTTDGAKPTIACGPRK